MNKKFQVFISSTYTDLLVERQAAVSAILKAGHIPAGMELFTAGDRSQLETIKQWIDESDIYMLILGGRYGSIEPISSVSYTEFEYDYATQQQKPVFAVVISDTALEEKVKIGGTKFIERENPKQLLQFRKKVLSNISSFFDDPKDIKLCVHESLSDFVNNKSLKGWVPADEVVDTKPLFDEIRKLSEENKELKEALVELKNRPRTQSKTLQAKNLPTFQELRSILQAIEVIVPPHLAGGTSTALSLFGLFYGNREILIRGVTNSPDTSEAESFFYFNICPKLQLHGLTINERIPGTPYRRSATSSLGQDFLAEMDRKVLKKEIQLVDRANLTQ